MKPNLVLLATALYISPAFAATPVASSDVGANDFQFISSFDAGSFGQIQHVVTNQSSYLTRNLDSNVVVDVYGPNSFANANKASNYHVAKTVMTFSYTFAYHAATGTNLGQTPVSKMISSPTTSLKSSAGVARC